MLGKLKEGYAKLLDAPVTSLEHPGLSAIETEARLQRL